MRNRPLSLDEYGISTNRYRELLYFCRQYGEKRKELATARGLDAVASDGMPHGNAISDPTARKADEALKLREDIALIEDTARDVDPVNWTALLRNVTECTQYEYMQVYSGRRQFYEARRKFFWLLDQRKKGN